MFTRNEKDSMYQDSNSTQNKKRWLWYSLIGIAIVAVSFFVALFVFRSIIPTKNATTATQTQPPFAIDTALATYSVSDLQNNYQKIDGPVSSILHYKQSNAAYGIDMTSTHAVSFTAKDATQHDTSGIQTQTADFFKAKGLALQKSPNYSTTSTTYTTFVGDAAVCQLGTPKAVANVPATISLACETKTTIDKEYSFINKLVGLYETSNAKLSFTHASRNLVTEGNKSLSILRLTSDKSQPALLFAAIDNQWEYIAKLSDGSSAASNGKFVPSAELTATLKNPKYGEFLTKNIQ